MNSYPTTRKDAIAAGIGQYFTGKPCKHGHFTYRYTTSGACADCVSNSSGVLRDALRGASTGVRERAAERRAEMLAPVIAARNAKIEALNALVPIRLMSHDEHVETILETAIALCLQEHPALERLDVLPSRAPLRGTPLYVVKVPPQHVQLMRDISNELWNTKKRDFSHLRQQHIKQAEKIVDDEASPPPEGWR